jgi:adenine-specific DNA-methyltransferase
VSTSEIASLGQLISVSFALGSEKVAGWSQPEAKLADFRVQISPNLADSIRRLIKMGRDPLGSAFCRLREPDKRRSAGATYTPLPIVRSMIAWAKTQATPARIVDPGSGSGRFIVNAGRYFSNARLIAIETDPVAALMTRAHLAAAELQNRAKVVLCDYRSIALKDCDGPTLFIGNPPYVRHHLIGQKWKDWFTRKSAERNFSASQLAGLHVHFFLATAELAKPGDYGAFITAAEWLDVNYGSVLRKLFLNELGGQALQLIEPTALPFPDAATTAVISSFKIGSSPASIKLRRVERLKDLRALNGGRAVRRQRLETANRWTPLTRSVRKVPDGYVELGELCRVHRGQVTGANEFWIEGPHSSELPKTVLFPTVTRAREIYEAGLALVDGSRLRRVIDLPEDLDALAPEYRKVVAKFLILARNAGVQKGYIARHRKAWWSVGLYEPAPILATYMARRPPGFARNLVRSRHINIAHGIYPRENMTPAMLDTLTEHLARTTTVAEGRTYAGGLTKFEPKEMERLLVPAPEALAVLASQ